MSKSSMINTLKTAITLQAGLHKGYKFKLADGTELKTINEIIQADNELKLIEVYKPDGTLAYIQNKEVAPEMYLKHFNKPEKQNETN